MLLADARVVTPDGVLDPGWVLVEGDRIGGVGSGAAPDGAAPDGMARASLHGRHILPGFVDLHVHGGGGHSMQSADADEIRAAVAFHRSHGTTSLVVSVMSAPLDEMLATLRSVAELTGDGGVLGAHLEGPFLNPLRAGAHDPRVESGGPRGMPRRPWLEDAMRCDHPHDRRIADHGVDGV